MTVWGGNCLSWDRNKIDRVINRARKFVDCDEFDNLLDKKILKKITSILKDETHPLYIRLPHSTRHNNLISIKTKTERHRRSFLPNSIRIYNSQK